MAKILGFCASPRKAATDYVIQTALEDISKKAGIETDFLTLCKKKISPCNGCGYCKKNHSWCCIKDDFGPLLDQFLAADAYLIGSPVYVYSPSPQLFAFFSRMRPLFHIQPDALRTKLGSAIAVGGTRNGGEEMTVNGILNLMMGRGINIICNEPFGYAGGFVWSKDQGAKGCAEDEEGMGKVMQLANKLADMTLLLEAGKKSMKQTGE